MSTLALNDRLSPTYVAMAGQRIFAADFPLLRDPDTALPVGIYVRRVRAGVAALFGLADFTIQGETANGFNIRLNAASLVDDKVQVFGLEPAERKRAHAPGGQTRTDTLEGDATQFTATIQELRRDTDQALRFPLGEASAEFLPGVAKANTVLGFDAAGHLKYYDQDAPIVPGVALTLYPTIAALRASADNPEIAFVEGYYAAGDGGGGPPFRYDPADVVSPDDGAACVLDSIGRRYKRMWAQGEWFDFRWAGAVGDGTGTHASGVFTGTDNAPAILRTTYLMRQADAAGQGFKLRIPAGQFNFDAGNCGYYWWNGCRKLEIEGAGQTRTTLQNTYAGADGNLRRPLFSCFGPPIVNTTGGAYVGIANGAALAWRINDVAIGATQFTCITPGDAAAWAPGDWVLLTSNDIQWLGYPPNADRLEYHKVLTSNAGTGVVTFEEGARHLHLGSFPDGGALVFGGYQVGKPRAWKLNGAVSYVPDPLNFPAVHALALPWDIDHTYRGLNIPHGAIIVATYMAIGGRRMRFVECTLVGVSPTVGKEAIFERCTFTDLSEPDKLVESISFLECDAQSGVNFQSASIEHVYMRGGHFAGFGCGTAKYVVLDNPDIDQLLFGSIYGRNRSVVINGGIVRRLDDLPMLAGNPQLVVDGVEVTYANGVFSILKAVFNSIYWGMVPGTTVHVPHASGMFVGDKGTAVVTDIGEDATHILVTTTFSFAAFPAEFGGGNRGLHILHTGPVTVNGTQGCALIRQLAECTRLGRKPKEFVELQHVNMNTAGGDMTGFAGEVDRIEITVHKKSTVAGKHILYGFYLLKNDTFDDQKLLNISIDLDTPGRRIITLTDAILLGADTLFFDVGAVTALPANRLTAGLFNWAHNVPLPMTIAQNPMISIRVFSRLGLFGDVLQHELDRTVNPVTRVTGGVLA